MKQKKRKDCWYLLSLLLLTIAIAASCGGGGGGGGGTTYTVGGTVNGLSGIVVLQNNGGDDLTITANGSFTFAIPIANGSSYNVMVKTQPSGQTCSAANSTGTVSGANVTNVIVACTDSDISMITPYKNSFDMSSINEAFSSTASAPWGFVHDGIDFSPNGNLKPFQAVSSGVVEVVMLMQNNISSNWQVNVRIKYNSTYSVEYAFEPFSAAQSDGNTQLANILVSVGQNVAQGDVIGNLYTVGSGAHVHFGLYKSGAAICPEPYFTPEARTSILNLLYVVWPNANMCY